MNHQDNSQLNLQQNHPKVIHHVWPFFNAKKFQKAKIIPRTYKWHSYLSTEGGQLCVVIVRFLRLGWCNQIIWKFCWLRFELQGISSRASPAMAPGELWSQICHRWWYSRWFCRGILKPVVFWQTQRCPTLHIRCCFSRLRRVFGSVRRLRSRVSLRRSFRNYWGRVIPIRREGELWVWRWDWRSHRCHFGRRHRWLTLGGGERWVASCCFK